MRGVERRVLALPLLARGSFLFLFSLFFAPSNFSSLLSEVTCYLFLLRAHASSFVCATAYRRLAAISVPPSAHDLLERIELRGHREKSRRGHGRVGLEHRILLDKLCDLVVIDDHRLRLRGDLFVERLDEHVLEDVLVRLVQDDSCNSLVTSEVLPSRDYFGSVFSLVECADVDGTLYVLVLEDYLEAIDIGVLRLVLVARPPRLEDAQKAGRILVSRLKAQLRLGHLAVQLWMEPLVSPLVEMEISKF